MECLWKFQKVVSSCQYNVPWGPKRRCWFSPWDCPQSRGKMKDSLVFEGVCKFFCWHWMPLSFSVGKNLNRYIYIYRYWWCSCILQIFIHVLLGRKEFGERWKYSCILQKDLTRLELFLYNENPRAVSHVLKITAQWAVKVKVVLVQMMPMRSHGIWWWTAFNSCARWLIVKQTSPERDPDMQS